MNRTQPILIFAIASMTIGAAQLVHAQDSAQSYDQVSLSASAEQQVENNLVIATVYAEAQAEVQSEAADRVNEAIQWALDTARAVENVEAQTTQYSTYPVHGNNNRVVGWRVRQTLRLESEDVAGLSELLGDLQERVAIQSMSYDVSEAARNAVEESLISSALTRFNGRAALVADELGRDGYRIVQINIDTNGGRPIPVAYRSFAGAAEADVATPAIDAGVQTVTVSVNGTIELNPLR